MTIVAVIITDLILVGALIAQLASFDASLGAFLRAKVQNTFAFLDFQYTERFRFSELGLSRYTNDSSRLAWDALLHDDRTAIMELRRQFSYDRIWRTNEVIALLNRTGGVVSSSGPVAATGRQFVVDGIVDYYMRYLYQTGAPFRMSVPVDRDYYVLVEAPVFDAVGDHRPDLVSWMDQDQTLARLLLMPVHCGPPGHDPDGFVVNVDSLYPRQYDAFGPLLSGTKSAIGAVLFRNFHDGQWYTAFSYNQAGQYGAGGARFPDLARDAFTEAQLGEAMAAGPAAVVTGAFTYGQGE